MDVELERAFGSESCFSMVDLGSCYGFFSLQASVRYPHCAVVSVEGSVGIGNGTTGMSGTEDEIIQTRAVQTHVRWIEKLRLANAVIAPEVWDYERVCALAALRRPICDVLLSLSVIHHVDNVSTELYEAEGLSHVEGSLALMARLLDLAPRHFIELPDRPWMEHMYAAYGSAQAFLHAAAAANGRQWSFVGPLCICEWYGYRELWLLEEVGHPRIPIPVQGLKGLFGRTLSATVQPQERQSQTQQRYPGIVGPTGTTQNLQHPRPQWQQQEQQHCFPRQQAQAQRQQLQRQSGLQDRHHGFDVDNLQQDPLASGTGQLGAMLLSAPTALIAAHVQLRDACAAAEAALNDARAV